MTKDIHAFVKDAHELVGLGEADHREPAFGQARNEIFAQLVDRGFRSIAFESDRVAGLLVDDFVREGAGDLDTAMDDGFSHGFGAFDANRELVTWMREYNEGRPPAERLAFHGIDAPWEFGAPSPRRDLECARDYLGLDLDLAGLVGDEERWGSAEAVMDPAESPGDAPEAHRLRAIADDMLTALYARAPELIAATSPAAWRRAKIHLASGLGLLRYHRQAAQRIEDADRWNRLSATRDSVMAQNLLDIRDLERRRGPTLVFGHNVHLQLNASHMSMAGMDLAWFGTGAVVASLLGERYSFIAGRLDSGDGGGEDPPRRRSAAWRLTAPGASLERGALPPDSAALDGADAVLHVSPVA